jgi:hypothetical protein
MDRRARLLGLYAPQRIEGRAQVDHRFAGGVVTDGSLQATYPAGWGDS